MDSVPVVSPQNARLGATRGRRLAGIMALASLLIYTVLLARNIGAYAGGSDSSGYMNEARLLAHGSARIAPRTVAGFRPAEPHWVYSPLGFKPTADGAGLAPTYPLGMPLWIAAAARLVGWAGAAHLVLLLHAIAGVILTYAAARGLGLTRFGAYAAAAMVCTSPVYLFIAVQTMTDVAALVWTTAAILAACRSNNSRAWAAFGGACFAMAVLIRPSDALALVPIAITLRGDLQRWVCFGAGGVPGAIGLAIYNHAAYGAVIATGYQDLNFGTEWVGVTLRHYAAWLPVVFTPAVIAALGLPWLRTTPHRTRWLLVGWFAVFAVFYAAYNCTHETWWYLRFLLPAAPALVIGALLVLTSLTSTLRHRVRLILAVAGVCAAVGWNAWWSIRFDVLHAGREEEKYLLLANWSKQNLPANAIVAAMQESGALLYYTEFTFVRWDFLTPTDFTGLTALSAKTNRPIYAILFPFEIDSLNAFRDHMPGGEWAKIGQVHEVTIWQWPSGRNAKGVKTRNP